MAARKTKAKRSTRRVAAKKATARKVTAKKATAKKGSKTAEPKTATRKAAPKSAPGPLADLRRISLALPESKEVPAWGTSTFRCGKIFAMYANPSDHQHSGGRPAVWLKAAFGVQEMIIRDRPDRFFKPPYVGPSGWIGVWLDRRPDWKEVALLVEDSWRLVAPKKLVKAREG